jgi:hypothetical protein
MRRVSTSVTAVAALVLAGASAQAQDASRAVSGGGISVPGWMGKIDPREESSGQKLENAKFERMGDGYHVTTGPSVAYWNPANRATGTYTVKATFREPKYMALNNHPHPYGVFIGGNDMGTAQQSYLYCMAYGNGSFIVRGFSGDTTFRLNGGRGETHAAVNKAAGPGEPVQQEIAINVTPDKVECAINGQVVGSYPKADVVAARKLKSTDGIWGIRFGHNTEAHVTGVAMTPGAGGRVTK